MRFLIDSQLPPALADQLQLAGHEANHVARIGLQAASDAVTFKHAQRSGSVIITKDADFPALARDLPVPPQIVGIRLGNVTNVALKSVMDATLPELIAALEDGEAIVEIR